MTQARSPNRSFDRELDSALTLMAKAVSALGHSPKPLVLHSARVALYLYNQGYGRNVVLAGALHDLLEDTTLPPDKIQREFGDGVLRLVEANTFDASISDRMERSGEMYARCLATGKDALLIKLVDTLDNSHYWHLVRDEDERQYLLGKYQELLDLSEELLRGEPVWEELRMQVARLVGAYTT